MKYYLYTLMNVSFERPRTIRGFNNHSIAKKYPYFSTKIQLYKKNFQNTLLKNKYETLPLYH